MIFPAAHGLSFVANFLIMREYRSVLAVRLITWPFIRCFALLGAIAVAFAAASLVPRLATTVGFATVLIAMKMLGDYRLHLSEHQAYRGTSRQAPS